ncbi:MAG: MOSC domain-containing protein [Candidatus Thermoplasmatota archaeon]|nr:MOSC domain-containing protein [Candidatus Thermoplasmatota archaeon]
MRVSGLFSGPKQGLPKDRSIPKNPEPNLLITKLGAAGDINHYRLTKKNNEEDMAILVLSSQELEQLKQKGYDFLPGDLGENILIEGLPVDQIKPDMYLNFESGLSLQFSRICDPCSKLNQLPNIGSKRIKNLLKDAMGLRGWYARVIVEEKVSIGDLVEIHGISSN